MINDNKEVNLGFPYLELFMQYVYYEWGGSLQTGKLITKYGDNVNSEPNYHLPAWTYYETQNIIIYWEKNKLAKLRRHASQVYFAKIH